MYKRQGKHIVVEKGNAIDNLLRKEYPDLELVYVKDSHDAIRYLAAGQVDAYIGSLITGDYLARELGITNIEVAAPAPFGPNELCFAIRKDWPVLGSLITKAESVITEAEHYNMRNKYTTINFDYGINPIAFKKWGLIAAMLF